MTKKFLTDTWTIISADSIQTAYYLNYFQPPPSDSVLNCAICRILLPTSPPSGPAQHSNEENDVAALSDLPSVEEPLVLPPLPLFRFPEAGPTLFGLPLGEKGHSRIEISIQYDTTALPDQPTEVHVIVKCFATGSRRISSLSLQITVQINKVDNVRPEKIVVPERTTEVGATHRKKKTALHGAGRWGSRAWVKSTQAPNEWTRRRKSRRAFDSRRCRLLETLKDIPLLGG